MTRPYLAAFELPPGAPPESYPFADGEVVIVLGEIEQMPGHVIVGSRETGMVIFGYHTEDFRKLASYEC